MPEAKIYSVQTIRGTVYALHQLSSGMIWTERSETAARQLAQEKRFQVVGEENISHAELLRLMGHEPMAPKPPTSGAAATKNNATAEIEDVTPLAPPPKPLSFDVRYHWDDEEPVSAADEAVVIPTPKSSPFSDVFFSDDQLAGPDAGRAQSEKVFDTDSQNNLPPHGIV